MLTWISSKIASTATGSTADIRLENIKHYPENYKEKGSNKRKIRNIERKF
jgi:hypothetical protein